MRKVCDLGEGTVQNALAQAVWNAYLNDRALFGEGVKSERAIVFQVGRYLAQSVDAWPGSWVVDAEYGRWYPEQGSVARKVLDGHSAIPDLIIHERGTKRNLLVVEAKVHPVDEDARERDYCKLRGFMTDPKFLYCFGVFLEIHRDGPPRWLWVDGLGEFDGPPPMLGGPMVEVPRADV
jgi:hypothetical protein